MIGGLKPHQGATGLAAAMSSIAIRVSNLSKQYRIGARQQRHTTLADAIMDRSIIDWVKTPFRRGYEQNVLWALQDVDFEVRQGEVLGIIGHNGAGKSTLLKILSRITKPSGGYAEVWGRIGSLLEVGTGFHPELTGRDNITLSGAIQGMTRQEIQRKFDAIVAFSGIDRMIDTPVKHYSSGMYLRLAFSVAAHLEPDILLVDEVLAVGDVEFQQRCLAKLKETIANGHTVLFVSHNMAAINSLSARALWLERGVLRGDGPTSEIIAGYLDSSTAPMGEKRWEQSPTEPNVDEYRLIAVRVRDQSGRVWAEIDESEPIRIEVEYEITRDMPYCRVGIVVVNSEGVELFETYDSDAAEYGGRRITGRYISRCVIPSHLFKPGRYQVEVIAGMFGVKNFVVVPNAIPFSIVETSALKSLEKNSRRGVISPMIEWTVESTDSVHQGNN
jgi:lipopolysaccharide transport system ATP-binding protein